MELWTFIKRTIELRQSTFDAYNWCMEIHEPMIDFHNWFMKLHNSEIIMELYNWFTDLHNELMELNKKFYDDCMICGAPLSDKTYGAL